MTKSTETIGPICDFNSELGEITVLRQISQWLLVTDPYLGCKPRAVGSNKKAKQLTCCQIDSLSWWNLRQTVMWWARVSVGALRWALPRQTASLWLLVCRCLCPALSQLFVYAAGQFGENRALPDPVTVSPLHPKSGPRTSFVLPKCCCWFYPGFQSHISLFFFFFYYCQRFMVGWLWLSFNSWMLLVASFGSDFGTGGTIKLSKILG